MAGLLDLFSGEDAGLLGLYLMQAAAPRAGGRASLGEGLLAGMQGVQQQRAAKEDRAARQQHAELQRQQQEFQLQQLKQQAAQQQAAQQWRQSIPSPQMGAAQQALSAGGGPTQANAQRMPAVDPMQELLHGGMKAGAIPVSDYLASLRPPKEDLMTVAEGATVWDRRAGKPVFTAPQKPQAADEFTRALTAAGLDPNSPQARALALQRLTKMATHAPGTSVSVNTGQKGLDNTLKLRGDFRSEPVYKAHQEMQAAYSQIQQSLKQASPAGDLAGATKIMKLLDPGSVVRESELGMAMAASGLLDRVQNYATNVIQGTKLTPTQRADFQRLADALYGESVKQYNGKRGEYQGIAERNQLSVPDVLGTESSMPVAGGGWSIKPKGP